jgi:hypothetical protein
MAGRKFNISEDHVLVKYAGTDADVVIPEGVTAIGWQAFLGCEGLRSVVIPEGVTDIGGYAFCGCYNLETVAIPKSVTSIGFGAFEGCYNLERVAIPENVTSIGGRAFYDCRKIRQVTVPAGVTRLENGVFGDCCSLTDAKLPEGLTLIDAHAFGDCGNLERIVIPEGVTSIGYMAFNGFWGANGCSGLKQVTLPESIRTINESAFDSKAKILFLTNKFSPLTPMQREQSVILFAEKGGECNEPYRSSYLKHIRSKAADYRESAMKHPALLELMHRENLIPAKDVQAYLKAAQTSGSAEAIALVLDYYANHLTASEKEKIEQGFYGESCLEEKF